ncbi:MAG: ActS/PrrB/RegB family redox-sensitive histidine kinase [Hyphomicrobiaceae bacterium]|nr:ActS/PrrB/RegB family redox-sensitive histidine kinase [Hyphomicrobiaceae bacterium]
MIDLPGTFWDRSSSRLRLQTSVRLRWFAVFGQLVTVGITHLAFGFKLPLGLCLAAIAFSAWVNIFLRILLPITYRLGNRLATGLLAYDLIQLAALLYLTGGIENPFVFLLVAPVTVSASTQPIGSTIALGLLAAATTIFLIFWHLPLPWHDSAPFALPSLFKIGIAASIIAGMAFLAFYAWRLSRETLQMSEALAATESVLAREQRLHALDGLAAAAAHELGTPLATITVVAKEMGRAIPKDSPLADDLILLQTQAIRCREILQKLTKSPGDQDPLHAQLTVTQLIEEASAPYRDLKARIRIDSRPSDGAPPDAHVEPFGQRHPGVIYGIGNLIENAIDFANGSVDVMGRWSANEIAIVIRDDGPGFATDVMDSLGDPYITTRSSRSRSAKEDGASAGLGLGFFIAKTLLERSGARLVLENRHPPETGAIVTVTWLRTIFERSPDENMWRLRKGPMSQLLPTNST